jgi:hypothetical protein
MIQKVKNNLAMKTLTLITILIFSVFAAMGQADTATVTNNEFETLIEQEEEVGTSVVDTPDTEGDVLSERAINRNVDVEKDTVHVRIGNQNIEIIISDRDTTVKIDDADRLHPDIECSKKPKRKFDGHWDGLDFGANLLLKTDYSMYPEGTPEFLEIRPEKSFEVNINLFEYSFGFGQYVGLVTGLGFNFNDYKFKNKYTFKKDENGVLQPYALPEGDFRKSKLSTVYLTAPLLFEFQIPDNRGEDRLFVAGGVIGGLKLGEHTKYKIGDEKSKDKGDHGIAPLRWGYTARIGFEDFGIYGTYYNTKLFEDGVGPATSPVTIGVILSF